MSPEETITVSLSRDLADSFVNTTGAAQHENQAAHEVATLIRVALDTASYSQRGEGEANTDEAGLSPRGIADANPAALVCQCGGVVIPGYAPPPSMVADCYIMGDTEHPDTRNYVAENLLKHIDLMPDTGDWHSALRQWAAASLSAVSARLAAWPTDPANEPRGDSLAKPAISEHEQWRRDLVDQTFPAPIGKEGTEECPACRGKGFEEDGEITADGQSFSGGMYNCPTCAGSGRSPVPGRDL